MLVDGRGFFHLLQVYGNNAEIQALCEMYNRPIHIFSYGTGANYVNIRIVVVNCSRMVFYLPF